MIIDLTHVIRNGLPVFPGDDETVLAHTRQFDRDYYNNHQLSTNMHAGTHIDGPMHLLDIDRPISAIPLDTFVGEGCLLNVCGQETIDYKEEYEDRIREGQIVILHTGHGKRFGEPGYFTDYPVLTDAFAGLLVKKRVKMIGLDTPSPDKAPYSVHKTLLGSQILIIENLANVDKLADAGDTFEIIALPLSIEADSSVARVIARIRDKA